MGKLLQFIAAIYLALLGAAAFAVLAGIGGQATSVYGDATRTYVIVGLVGLALPAIALYAFGQLVTDTRATRETLAEMLKLLRDGR